MIVLHQSSKCRFCFPIKISLQNSGVTVDVQPTMASITNIQAFQQWQIL